MKKNNISVKGLTKIGKVSFGLVLPKEMLSSLKISKDDAILIQKIGNSIVIKKYENEKLLEGNEDYEKQKF